MHRKMESYQEFTAEKSREYRQSLSLDIEDTKNITEELLHCAASLRQRTTPDKSEFRVSSVPLDGHDAANHFAANLNLNSGTMSGDLRFGWNDRRQSFYKYKRQGDYGYWDNGENLISSSNMLLHLDDHTLESSFNHLLDDLDISDPQLFTSLRDSLVPIAQDWTLKSIYETADYSGLDSSGALKKHSLARIMIGESLKRQRQPVVVLEAVASPQIELNGNSDNENPTTEQALRFTMPIGASSYCELFTYGRRTDLPTIIKNSQPHNERLAPIALMNAIKLLDRNKYNT